MRAAILSVGSELLLGDLVDTNAAWLSTRLGELGIEVVAHHAAGDDLAPLVEAIRWLCARSDLVLIGGGLGPTHDDLTRDAVATAAGVELEHHDELAEMIIQRFAAAGVRMPAANLRQARIPAGARVIEPVGTAPGFALDVGGGERPPCLVVALPGVPWELEQLFERDVVPMLTDRTGAGVTVTRVVHVSGSGESAVAEDLAPLLERAEAEGGVTVAFLAKQQEIQVRITVTAADRETAATMSQPWVEEVLERVGVSVAGVDDEDLEEVVARLLQARGRTVAAAESCTAGEVIARLARVPGSSAVVRGGIATYATDTKRDLLGVDGELLEENGPVCEPVTRAMALRAREVFAADYGIGITCSAGPTAQGDSEVGDSYWALAHPDGRVECHHRRFPGDRTTVKARLGTAAIDLLRRRLLEDDADALVDG